MDAKDCRESAKRCIEMANNARGDKTQSMLFELAAEWTKLADEIDVNPALRGVISGVNASKSSLGCKGEGGDERPLPAQDGRGNTQDAAEGPLRHSSSTGLSPSDRLRGTQPRAKKQRIGTNPNQ